MTNLHVSCETMLKKVHCMKFYVIKCFMNSFHAVGTGACTNSHSIMVILFSGLKFFEISEMELSHIDIVFIDNSPRQLSGIGGIHPSGSTGPIVCAA